ncbi:uncharacterized protein LOC128720438 [Anopheles nili]|uniref:uncharacterized protein LOC128720438 n=1 Tax=Anopheles nili TaxID=185578 RepID=UPI00237BB967|nr:uncharacterized protein LOC128720438 [Anopheles nili]
MEPDRKEKFLTTELVSRIIQANDTLQGYRLAPDGGCTLTTPKGLDGFMSTIHRLKLNLTHSTTGDRKSLTLMVKVMKGDDAFRQKSLGLVLFPNEINVYSHVIPVFKRLVQDSGSALIDELQTLCPRVYLAESDVRYPAYSDQVETFLVMEDVSGDGFVPGPRLNLDQLHLELMARKIAQFHACSYALRLGGHSDRLRQLVDRIIPLNFMQDGKIFFESYDVVFRVVFERLFRYLSEHSHLLETDYVRTRVEALRDRYGSVPSELMQRFLARDDTYSVILHGDYNRNNVLFRYENGLPQDVMLIDFQENRFGSPGLDLSFFMYMNMPPEAWANGGWDQLLAVYHRELLRGICEIVRLKPDDPRLKPYRWDAMKLHLQSHFLYGAIIAIKFLPCMLASEPEVEQIVHYFHNNILADEFRQIYQVAGGETVDDRISKVIIHAAQQGYLDMVLS